MNNYLISPDIMILKDKARVSRVHIHAASIVDSIQLEYDGHYRTPVHGGPGGKEYTMEIEMDDYITEIDGSLGSYKQSSDCDTIGSLTIKTRKGKSATYGTERYFHKKKGFVCKASGGYQIFALAGKYIRTETLDNSYLSGIVIGMEKPCGR